MINFWATWCVPCRDEAPLLEAAWRSYRDRRRRHRRRRARLHRRRRSFVEKYGSRTRSPTTARRSSRAVGGSRACRDVLRRPRRQDRRAHGRRDRPTQQIRRRDPRRRSREAVVVVPGRARCRARRARERGSTRRRRARGRARLPDVQDDARPVERAGRAADEAVHRARGSRRATRKSEIKDQLVAQFGKGVLAAPEQEGFDLLAWVLPLVGLLGRRRRPLAAPLALDAAPRGGAPAPRVTGQLAAAFLAGLVSIAAPCVLPLVPGYVCRSSRAGRRRRARRARASVPFVLGFTVVFVALGAGAAALGSVLPQERRIEVAGFLLVVFGLAFAGLLPWPERLLAPRSSRARARLERAARRGVRGVRGAVRRRRARLGARARERERNRRAGIVLLTAYSLGLALAFLLVGLAFARVAASAPCATTGRASRVERRDPRRVRPTPLLPPRVVALHRLSARARRRRPRGGLAARAGGRARDLRARRRDVDAAVRGHVGRQPPLRLLQLPLAADPVAAAVLVPRDDDVHEALEEVALVRVGRAPRLLERLVRLEVAARPRELEPPREGALDPSAQCYPPDARGDDPAVWGRPLLPGQARGAACRSPPGHDRQRRPARARDRRHRADRPRGGRRRLPGRADHRLHQPHGHGRAPSRAAAAASTRCW